MHKAYKMFDLIGEDLRSLSMRDNVSGNYSIITFLGSVLFFYLINMLVKNCGPPSPVADEWKWRNVYISWIHSVIISVWTISCLMLYPELLSGLLYHINYFTYLCVTFSTGYFVYDFLDLYFQGKHWSNWELTAHHFAVTSIFAYNVVMKQQIGFSLIALCVEVNSVFLHWRKLLQMTRTPFNSTLYVIIKYVNLVSFIVFRGIPLTLITSFIILYSESLSMFYCVSVSTSMFVMNVINMVLLYRLIKSDVLRDFKKSKHHNDKNGNVMKLDSSCD